MSKPVKIEQVNIRTGGGLEFVLVDREGVRYTHWTEGPVLKAPAKKKKLKVAKTKLSGTCYLCENLASGELPDREIYLMHGNGGAYDCKSAHDSCIKKAIIHEPDREIRGWYPKNDRGK